MIQFPVPINIMDINMIQDLLYMVPRLTKIKFVSQKESKMVCWRFCRGHMYIYNTTATSASVDQIHTMEKLKDSFQTYLLDQKGFLKVKYIDDTPPDEYNLT